SVRMVAAARVRSMLMIVVPPKFVSAREDARLLPVGQGDSGGGGVHTRAVQEKGRRKGALSAKEALAERQPAAAATARRAITPTRCARYSALAWMSELSPSCFCAMDLIASAVKDLASAASIYFRRNTTGPAPVTATRILPPVFASNTPTIA